MPDYSSAAQMSPVAIIISLVISIFYLVCMWKLYAKAGKPGWAAIIPIYNMVVFFDIVYGKGWKFLLMLIPIFGEVVAIASMIRLAQNYGKSVGFGVLNLFFSFVTIPMLAFGSSDYEGPIDSFI